MRGGIPILGALCLVLAGVVAIELRSGGTVESTAHMAVPGQPPRPSSSASGSGDSAAWIATALARPVFTASRRPPSQAAAPVVVAGPPGLPRLTGVMAGPFGRRAIFAGPEGGKPLVVSVGDAVGEFKVLGIENGEVALRGPDGTRRLRPSFAAAGAPDAAAQDAASTPGAMPNVDLPPGVLPEDVSPVHPTGRRR